MGFFRKAVIQSVLVLLAGFGLSSAYAGEAVKVMTRNMDAGTDFGFFIANLDDPAPGVQQTLQEVLKNDFATRAQLLAKEIALTKPDLVGLQEATIWSLPTPNGTDTIDQLELLLGALSSDQYNLPYAIVAVNTLTNLGFPIPNVGTAQFTDRDVVIMRVGSAVTTSNSSSHIYAQLVPLPPPFGTVKRGWISVDATVGGKTFKFVTTHLESSAGLYGDPTVDLIQAAQAQELANAFADSPIPIVIAGDFNSNATHTPVDRTQSFNIMLGKGYVDAWSALHRGIPGFTWPLYLEDPLRDHTQGPKERIDLVFSKGVYPTSVTRTGLQWPFGSDHAGVLATFDF